MAAVLGIAAGMLGEMLLPGEKVEPVSADSVEAVGAVEEAP